MKKRGSSRKTTKTTHKFEDVSGYRARSLLIPSPIENKWIEVAVQVIGSVTQVVLVHLPLSLG